MRRRSRTGFRAPTRRTGVASRRSPSPRAGPRARGSLPAGGRTTPRRRTPRMAGAGCRPPARTSGSPGSRAGTADTNASAVRGPARRSNGRCWPSRRRPRGRAGRRAPGRAWPRVYLIRGARRSGPVRGLGSCAPGVTRPLAGPLPALLRCQRRPAAAPRATLSCAGGLQRGAACGAGGVTDWERGSGEGARGRGGRCRPRAGRCRGALTRRRKAGSPGRAWSAPGRGGPPRRWGSSEGVL